MKKLLVLAFACVATAVASASEIYWMVNPSALSCTTTPDDWQYARLVATKGLDHTANGTTIAAISRSDILAGEGAVGVVSGAEAYSSYSFVVELVKSVDYVWKAGETFGISGEPVSYDAIAYTGGMSSPTVYDFGASGFSAVPEPSTGLLFMLGMMMLGLKRKREQVNA